MARGGFITLYFNREERNFLKNHMESDFDESLGVHDLAVIFYIIVMGWIIALFAFIFEVTIFLLNKLIGVLYLRIFMESGLPII